MNRKVAITYFLFLLFITIALLFYSFKRNEFGFLSINPGTWQVDLKIYDMPLFLAVPINILYFSSYKLMAAIFALYFIFKIKNHFIKSLFISASAMYFLLSIYDALLLMDTKEEYIGDIENKMICHLLVAFFIVLSLTLFTCFKIIEFHARRNDRA